MSEFRKLASPCLLFVDELDAMVPKPESDPETAWQRERELRVFAQFLDSMNGALYIHPSTPFEMASEMYAYARFAV